jgi:hypothetical protein
VGLFDSDRRSLALVEGESIVSFGAETCLERVVDRLTTGEPSDLRGLEITATPNLIDHESAVLLRRPHFDLAVQGLHSDGGARVTDE